MMILLISPLHINTCGRYCTKPHCSSAVWAVLPTQPFVSIGFISLLKYFPTNTPPVPVSFIKRVGLGFFKA